MTFTRRVFTPTELSPAELVHVQTNVNEGDTLAAYKIEREQRAHENRVRKMRAIGFGQNHGVRFN